MKLSKQLTTVTPVSKMPALALFIVLPIIAFYLGMHYQAAIDINNDYSRICNLTETKILSIARNSGITNPYKDLINGETGFIFAKKYNKTAWRNPDPNAVWEVRLGEKVDDWTDLKMIILFDKCGRILGVQ